MAAAAGALLLVTALLMLWNVDLQRVGSAARYLRLDAHAATAAAAAAPAPQLQPPPHLLSASLVPPPPAPSPEALEAAAEAEALATHCSAEYRAQRVAAVANGSAPALIAGGWSCAGLEQVCSRAAPPVAHPACMQHCSSQSVCVWPPGDVPVRARRLHLTDLLTPGCAVWRRVCVGDGGAVAVHAWALPVAAGYAAL